MSYRSFIVEMGHRAESAFPLDLTHVPQAYSVPPPWRNFLACSTVLNVSVLTCSYSTPLPVRNTFTRSFCPKAKLANRSAFQHVSASLLEIIMPTLIVRPPCPPRRRSDSAAN